jgi:hypothetical protein
MDNITEIVFNALIETVFVSGILGFLLIIDRRQNIHNKNHRFAHYKISHLFITIKTHDHGNS